MNSTSQKMFSLLQEIASYLEQLQQALKNEYQALSDNNMPAIETIAREKTVLMDSLEDLDKERRNILSSAGLNLRATGIEDFLQNDNSGQAAELKTTWTKIADLTRQCEKQNNINGIIIENNKQHTENALSILQGKQQGTELYSRQGKSIKTAAKQTVIRA